MAKKYCSAGADEIVFFDIFATKENHEINYELISKIKKNINIPLIVRGGINSKIKVEKTLKSGANRVSLNSYTNYLLDKGVDKISKKLIEEAAETIIAAKNNDKKEIIYEMSDLLYHMIVLMNYCNISYSDICNELQSRSYKSCNRKKEVI